MVYIFDWDGTLCDSTGKIVQCMHQAAADLGLPILADNTVKNIIGLGLPQALQALYPDIDISEHDAIKSRYRYHFTQTSESREDLFDGVVDMLEALKASGKLLAIATGKSRDGLNRVLENMNLHDFFHATRCADETESKPHPKMLNELLSYFNIEAQRAVMVGDTEYDMEMAQAIAMPKIAVSYGAHVIDRLHKYQPELCIDHFKEIEQWQF